MRSSQPDAFLLPLLLPVFLIGLFPLLILGVVGWLGVGILGLLILFIAVGDELNASGVYSRHRSEEHTSELQSHSDLVCRLLLEKKKKNMVQKIEVAQTQLSPKVDRLQNATADVVA